MMFEQLGAAVDQMLASPFLWLLILVGVILTIVQVSWLEK